MVLGNRDEGSSSSRGSSRGRGRGRGRGAAQVTEWRPASATPSADSISATSSTWGPAGQPNASQRGPLQSNSAQGQPRGAVPEASADDRAARTREPRRPRVEEDREPNRPFFDALVKQCITKTGAVFGNIRDVKRFLLAIREHKDLHEAVYKLERIKFKIIRQLLDHVNPMHTDIGEFFSQHYLPTLRAFSQDANASISVKNLLVTFFETPNFLAASAQFIQEHEPTREDLDTMAWFLCQIARSYRERRDQELLSDPELLALVDFISSHDNLPYAQLLRGHFRTEGNGQLLAAPALEDFAGDALTPFRDVPVVVTMEEVTSNNPILQRVPYEPETLDELLSFQFSYLRADLLGSIREGLAQPRSRALGYLYNVRLLGVGHRNFQSYLEFTFDLHHAHPVLKKGIAAQEEYWKVSRIAPLSSIVLFVEHHEEIHDGQTVPIDIPRYLGIVSHRDAKSMIKGRIGITLQSNDDSTALLATLAQKVSSRASFTVITIASNFFAYEPILKRLQEIDTMPFDQEILGRAPENTVPAYFNEHHQLALAQLIQASTLNESQSQAMEYAFQNRVALVQGPPGTGKTFIGVKIGQFIVEQCNQKILLCCYTNHALDQFLEALVAAGVTEGIVRIGGYCKSDRLQRYCLNTFRGESKWSRAQAHRNYELKREREEIQKELDAIIGLLSEDKDTWDDIMSFLEDTDPDTAAALSVIDDLDGDDFHIVGEDGKTLAEDALWDMWLKGDKPKGYMRRKGEHHIWKLRLNQRKELYQEWLEQLRAPHRLDLLELIQKANQLSREIDELRSLSQRSVMMEARIIACTTSGAAKYFDKISKLNIPVMLVEEAGEILEAHILTALSPACQHMILIGDHKQLRPKVEFYPLQKESGQGYNFNVSLFERMVAAGIPHATLQEQHRMRVEISSFARMLTYPELRDAPHCKGRVSIKGLSHDIVFMSHKFRENANSSLAEHQSHHNPEEAAATVQVVKYLLKQGYAADQITVLTPYLGQLLILREGIVREMADLELGVKLDERDLEQLGEDEEDFEAVAEAPKKAKSVRVSTIDNYQGEESDIIIISLVRSNEGGHIGFLKEPERVNVMLTRAKLGMILLGNPETLLKSKGKEMWTKIFDNLKHVGYMGPGLPVKCQAHERIGPPLLTVKDFEMHAADGGCTEVCQFRFPCGHRCPRRCHIRELFHNVCTETTYFKCNKGHVNASKCCIKVPPPCDHCAQIEQAEEALKKTREAQQKLESDQRAKMAAAKIATEAKKQQELLKIAELNDEELVQKRIQEINEMAQREIAEQEEKMTEVQLKAREKLHNAELQKERQLKALEGLLLKKQKKEEEQMTQRIASLEEEGKKMVATSEAKTQLKLKEMEAKLVEEKQRMEKLEQELAAKRDQIARSHRVKVRQESKKVEAQALAVQAKIDVMAQDPQAVIEQVAECEVCQSRVAFVKGIACRSDHFTCDDCFAQHVQHHVCSEDRLKRGADVPCTRCDLIYPIAGVLEHLTQHPHVVVLLQQLISDFASHKARLEEQLRIAAERKRQEKMDAFEREVQQKHHHVVEEILNLHCPRCHAVFDSFDGCFALNCRTCTCAFCAWCLKDCGADAHTCATQCGETHGGRGLYGSNHQFEEHQTKRRQKLLDEYIGGLERKTRDALIRVLQKDVKDLRLRLPKLLVTSEAKSAAVEASAAPPIAKMQQLNLQSPMTKTEEDDDDEMPRPSQVYKPPAPGSLIQPFAPAPPSQQPPLLASPMVRASTAYTVSSFAFGAPPSPFAFAPPMPSPSAQPHPPQPPQPKGFCIPPLFLPGSNIWAAPGPFNLSYPQSFAPPPPAASIPPTDATALQRQQQEREDHELAIRLQNQFNDEASQSSW